MRIFKFLSVLLIFLLFTQCSQESNYYDFEANQIVQEEFLEKAIFDEPFAKSKSKNDKKFIDNAKKAFREISTELGIDEELEIKLGHIKWNRTILEQPEDQENLLIGLAPFSTGNKKDRATGVLLYFINPHDLEYDFYLIRKNKLISIIDGASNQYGEDLYQNVFLVLAFDYQISQTYDPKLLEWYEGFKNKPQNSFIFTQKSTLVSIQIDRCTYIHAFDTSETSAKSSCLEWVTVRIPCQGDVSEGGDMSCMHCGGGYSGGGTGSGGSSGSGESTDIGDSSPHPIGDSNLSTEEQFQNQLESLYSADSNFAHAINAMNAAPTWMWPIIQELLTEVLIEVAERVFKVNIADDAYELAESITTKDPMQFMSSLWGLLSARVPALKAVDAALTTWIKSSKAWEIYDKISGMTRTLGEATMGKFWNALNARGRSILEVLNVDDWPKGIKLNVDINDFWNDLIDAFDIEPISFTTNGRPAQRFTFQGVDFTFYFSSSGYWTITINGNAFKFRFP